MDEIENKLMNMFKKVRKMSPVEQRLHVVEEELNRLGIALQAFTKGKKNVSFKDKLRTKGNWKG